MPNPTGPPQTQTSFLLLFHSIVHILFPFGIQILQQHRNRVVFKNLPTSQTIHKEIIQRAVRYVFCAQNVAVNRPRVEKFIKWERPHRSWFKLTINGSLLGVDTTFCTPYDSSLRSPMMLKLYDPRPIQRPIRYQVDLRSVKMENITF